MKVGFITNLRAPYRTLQLNEYSNIEDLKITVYYCNDSRKNRNWETGKNIRFKEIDLEGYRILKKYGYINKGILRIIKNNDLIILGGYEQPTYIITSILCRLFKKPYILLFDGISTNRLSEKEHVIKKIVKNIVIKGSKFILGNGKVSERYFNEVFNYPTKRIYNQLLTVDSDKINLLYQERNIYRDEYRKKLNIKSNDKILIYSGRLIDIKNVSSVIKAISMINKKDIVFLIVGGGELEDELKKLADELSIRIIITGFLSQQEEVFKHYFVGDALILPSIEEPWGLVVNESMLAGLPVIVSQRCGCSLDLVKDGINGYKINPFDIKNISEAIENVLYKDDINKLSKESKYIIKEWKFKNSRKQLEAILNNLT